MAGFDKNIIRPVSIIEESGHVFANIVSRNKLKGKILIPVFRKALKVIVERHPFLQCVFFKLDNKVYFKSIDDFPLQLIIKENIASHEEKNNLYKAELNNLLDPYKQLWRILLILECNEQEITETSNIEMILTIHHAISDATAMFNLVKEILEQVQAVREGKVLYENKKLPVMPPVEDFLYKYIENSGIDIDKIDITALNNENIYRLNIDCSIAKIGDSIGYIKELLPESETKLLINRCKENKITVNGILCAAMIKAIGVSVEQNTEQGVKLCLNSPFNLRERIDPFPAIENLMAFAVPANAVVFINKEKNIIELAGEIIEQLNSTFKNNKGIKELLLFGKSEKAITIQDWNEFNYSILGLSNAGKINFSSNYGNLELIETDFAASNTYREIAVYITTFNNILGYVILFTKLWHETEFINKLNNCFKKHLQEFMIN